MRMRWTEHVARMQEMRNAHRIFSARPKEMGYLEDLSIDGSIMIKWTLREQDGMTWTGFRIGKSVRLLLTQWWNFRFNNMPWFMDYLRHCGVSKWNQLCGLQRDWTHFVRIVNDILRVMSCGCGFWNGGVVGRLRLRLRLWKDFVTAVASACPSVLLQRRTWNIVLDSST